MEKYSESFDETVSCTVEKSSTDDNLLVAPCLGIIWHPDQSRVGQIASLFHKEEKQMELSRFSPLFYDDIESLGAPLLDGHISRSPIIIKRVSAREYQITPPASKMEVMVNGTIISESRRVSLDEQGREIIISISNKIIIAIFERPVARTSLANKFGIKGISASVFQMWRSIELAAPYNTPVLIRGETGTGKELIAQALHALSTRAESQMLSINMATLTGDLAVSELFGAAKGAYTGASSDRAGLFEQASDSSLFLDEIAATAENIQPMLLRVLETQEIRRVGDGRSRKVNARVIAATDQNMEAEEFNQPLLRRLEAIVINIPPLRNRRVDIGQLVLHFLGNAVENYHGGLAELISGEQILKLVLHEWPGNIRELRNIVQQVAMGIPPKLFSEPLKGLDQHSELIRNTTPRKKYRDKKSVSEDEMLSALNTHNWCIKESAIALNISRTGLYDLMQNSPRVRRAEEIEDQEIALITSKGIGNINTWAKELRVGREALKRRLKVMNLTCLL
jgi:transcriptional regulator with GAF, ATPase, and Fis domain